MSGGKTGLVVMGIGKGEWEHGRSVYGLAGGLGQGLGFVQGQTIRLRPG